MYNEKSEDDTQPNKIHVHGEGDKQEVYNLKKKHQGAIPNPVYIGHTKKTIHDH